MELEITGIVSRRICDMFDTSAILSLRILFKSRVQKIINSKTEVSHPNLIVSNAVL